MSKKSLLVTGAHRSGSTFVGKMLSLHRSVGYIHEPFNKSFGLEGVDKWFSYVKIGMTSERYYKLLVEKLLAGQASYKKSPKKPGRHNLGTNLAKVLLKSRPNLDYKLATYNPLVNRFLIKDPIACMASEWLHREGGMDVIILYRHPAAFVASLKRLNWVFDFEDFFSQHQLMEDHLFEVLRDKKTHGLSIVEQGCLLWNSIYTVLTKYADRNPDMAIVRHEDISSSPVSSFMELYERFDLPFDKNIEQKVRKLTQSGNPVDPFANKAHVLRRDSRKNISRWKNILTDQEIRYVNDQTKDLAMRFYPESDW